VRRETERQPSFRTIAAMTAIPVVAFVAFLIHALIRPHARSVDDGPTRPSSSPKTKEQTRPTLLRRGNIVLILDDVGFEGQPLRRAMALDPNVNFAVLPNGTRAADYASLLNDSGFEILCHLPMEPQGEAAPGPNAVLTSMTDAEIAAITRANLRAVPYARGVNNHMGSRATTDRRVMSSVFNALPDGMYFIDSRTGQGSVAEAVAREMRVRTASRHIFLDNEQSEDAIRRQIRLVAETARAEGTAVAIGHLYPATIATLEEEIPGLKRQGFRFVRASQAVN
jgi:polysaccharide deacetylase 2 family uncharacterized protein YibQ